VLGHCPALIHLDLRWNQIGPAGAESFAGVLGQCPSLAHLDLHFNQMVCSVALKQQGKL
jgi:Ran GTPase-activating protein (RanGAP) involved in mRNA processing and transport